MVRRPHRGKTLAAALACTALLAAGSAPANPLSERLHARGLVEFAQGNWDKALRFFDQAVREDPGDARARYFRGLAAAKLGRVAEARGDLEAALAAEPGIERGPLDLGILYLDAGDLEKARTRLLEALERPATRFTASLLLGIAAYRSGNRAEAARYLEEAARDPALREAARYYQAVVAARAANDEDTARSILQSLRKTAPGSPFAAHALPFLQGRAPEPAATGKRPRRWRLDVATGFAYDTNVVLAADDDAIKDARGIGNESDGRFVFEAGAAYRLLASPAWRLDVGYDLSQSVHFDLRDFDLQSHRLSASAATRWGTVAVGLSAAYDFYLLDYESFLHEGIALPWLRIPEGERAATEVSYRFRGRDFTRLPFDPFRDAVGNAVGVRQLFRLPRVRVAIGYQFEDETALSSDGDDFDLRSHQGEIEVRWESARWGSLSVGYLARIEDYRNPNSRSLSGFRRHDFEQQAALDFERSLWGRIFGGVRYVLDRNDSNLPEFEFTRHVVIVRLGVHL